MLFFSASIYGIIQHYKTYPVLIQLQINTNFFFYILWHKYVISLVTVFYNDVLVGKKWNQY